MPKHEFPGRPLGQPDRAGSNGGDGGDDDVLEWMDQHVAAGTRRYLPTDSQASVAGPFSIGAALCGLVAKNFLEAHRIAQRQLNFYFVEPDQELATQDQEVDQAARIRDQLVEAMLDVARASVILGQSVTVAKPADGTNDSAWRPERSDDSNRMTLA